MTTHIKALNQTLEHTVAGKPFSMAGIKNSDGGNLKKIYVGANASASWVEQTFPGAEIVHSTESILNDNDIDLVIIPEPQKENINIVAEILNTGKNVRII